MIHGIKSHGRLQHFIYAPVQFITIQLVTPINASNKASGTFIAFCTTKNNTAATGGSMNVSAHLLTFIVFVQFIVVSSFAQERIIADTVDREKPYLIVTPSRPVAGEDEVILQIILGTAPSACDAPTYRDLSFTVTKMEVDGLGNVYSVNVRFVEVPKPDSIGCITLYDPVDYGPRFALGKLRAGVYIVRWDVGNSEVAEKIYGRFEVFDSPVNNTYTLQGRVYDDPFPLERASMPISGAKVYLVQHLIVLETEIASTPERIIAPERLIDSTITDEDGSYSFLNLAAGGYELRAMHREYQNASVGFTLTDNKIVNIAMLPIGARAAVGGQVRLFSEDTNEFLPIAGCTVSVAKARLTEFVSSSEIVQPLLTAITGDDGSYLIEGIPIETNNQVWYVTAVMGDRFNETKSVRLSNGMTERVDFTLTALYQNSSSVEERGVIFTTATSKRSYYYNEPVKIRYSITNTNKTTVEFGPFSSGCEYELVITPLLIGIEPAAYRASDTAICRDAVSYIRVEPGETVVYDFPDYIISRLPKIASADLEIRANTLMMYQVAVGLRGDECDYSVARVTIEVNYDLPPVGVETQALGKVHSAARLNAQTGKLLLSLDKEQNVSVVYYTLKGAVIPGSSFSKRFTAGVHTLALQKGRQSRGFYIVGVKGADFEKRFPSVYSGR